MFSNAYFRYLKKKKDSHGGIDLDREFSTLAEF